MEKVELFIHGKSVPATHGQVFNRVSPLDGSIASQAPRASLEDIDAAIESASIGFSTWSKLKPTERKLKLLKAAEILEQNAERIISIGTKETGSSPSWYEFNVHLAANMLREAASMVNQINGSVMPTDTEHNISMSIRVPCGVVVGMAPWNAPVILAIRALAMPLACGNTVVLKASEGCPAVHVELVKILNESGLGNGVINVVTHSNEDAPWVVEHLVKHPKVKRINFTGSTHVGKIIAAHAATCLKPVILELGGKAPVVVHEDANLDNAINSIAFGAFFNQGQVCMSTERVIVHENIYQLFVEKLLAKTQSLKAGNPYDKTNHIGVLESEKAAQRVRVLLEDALNKGAKIPLGVNIKGTVMQPTVVLDIDESMQIYSEETFGPICTVVSYANVEEAIEIANNTNYGLSAAVFSENMQIAHEIANQIESGICHINGATIHDEAHVPFGGVKDSGYGTFGSNASIEFFTQLRWVTVQTSPRHYPF